MFREESEQKGEKSEEKHSTLSIRHEAHIVKPVDVVTIADAYGSESNQY
jgi:hypothetical protein